MTKNKAGKRFDSFCNLDTIESTTGPICEMLDEETRKSEKSKKEQLRQLTTAETYTRLRLQKLRNEMKSQTQSFYETMKGTARISQNEAIIKNLAFINLITGSVTKGPKNEPIFRMLEKIALKNNPNHMKDLPSRINKGNASEEDCFVAA